MDEENFIKGAKRQKSTPTNVDLHDLSKCVLAFKNRFASKGLYDAFAKKDFETIANLGADASCDTILLRPTVWKLTLNYYGSSENLFSWLTSAQANRDLYATKVKEYKSPINYSTDPLGQTNSEWSSFFQDNEIKKLIIKDVDRTYQEKDLFKNTIIKELLVTILFLWAKENKKVGYWQGMNEILALVFLALHPYYHEYKNKMKPKNIALENQNVDWEQIYLYFHDKDELGADCYALFCSLMNKAIRDIFDKTSIKDSGNLNADKLISNLLLLDVEKKVDFLTLRVNSVMTILKEVDSQVYSHLIKNEVDFFMIGQRWYRCCYNREFHPSDCLKILDTLISVDYLDFLSETKKDKSGYFALLEFFSCAMILYIKEDLLSKERTNVYMRLNKYPPVESINLILNSAVQLKRKFEGDILKRSNSSIKKKEISQPKISFNRKEDAQMQNSVVNSEKKKEELLYFGNNDTDSTSAVTTSINFQQLSTDLTMLLSKYGNIYEKDDKEKLVQVINILSKLGTD